MAETILNDAADEWIVIHGMGGYVCSVCGDPVESEPCIEHQRHAHAKHIGARCPECGETQHLYYGRSWCASCGWHLPGSTLQHADFTGDPECRWCNPGTDDSESDRG